MKKYIATLVVVMALGMPVQTQACGICKPVEKALRWIGDWLEASHCLAMRARIAQLRGGSISPCDHNPRHDNAGRNEK